eukprot:15469019-Alexandrium_andersonii.AAC.1
MAVGARPSGQSPTGRSGRGSALGCRRGPGRSQRPPWPRPGWWQATRSEGSHVARSHVGNQPERESMCGRCRLIYAQALQRPSGHLNH